MRAEDALASLCSALLSSLLFSSVLARSDSYFERRHPERHAARKTSRSLPPIRYRAAAGQNRGKTKNLYLDETTNSSQ